MENLRLEEKLYDKYNMELSNGSTDVHINCNSFQQKTCF